MYLIFFLFHTVFSRNPPGCTWSSPPKIISIIPTPSVISLQWTFPTNNGYTLTLYQVEYATPNWTNWKTSTNIGMINWTYPQAPLSDMLLDSMWNDFQLGYQGQFRYAQINVVSSMVYRIRVRGLAENCDWSPWSDINITNSLGEKWSFLEVQGTGSNNLMPAYVKLGNSYLLYSESIRGLHLMVLHRQDLSVVYNHTYDTFGSVLDSTNLAIQLSSYNANYLIILISCDAWEKNFIRSLGIAIQNLGGILIKEFGNVNAVYPSYKTVTSTPYRHPYAFIGIPGQAKIDGQNFEALRNNTEYYNYNDTKYHAIPTAKLRVTLRLNSLRQFYFLSSSSTWKIGRDFS
ncbi:mglC [Blepharisma stoltei]|uniref:ILEI/PANDER domain-containing protein n=1 Tax=Blepharisma stoltei TaxID=1481888 RepID=A0AAU9JFJ8_9CILI|nr:unnamed protein product [Blepharisma stoltei]